MPEQQPQLSWLSAPSVFRVGRIDAHSDHGYCRRCITR